MDVPDQSDAEEFTKFATSPAAWFGHAEHLRESSELLWQPIGKLFDPINRATRPTQSASPEGLLHVPAYLLVAGFALEAILKAAAIQVELNAGGVERIIVAGPAPTLRPWVKTHKLEGLAAKAGISVQGELLSYLRRFEKHLLWAGRYPVPLRPPSQAEPRGFDYRVGAQDLSRFRELYELARVAYFTARDAQGAWPEPTSVGDYRQRESVWIATLTDWLGVVGTLLIEHGVRVAAGDRGVLQVNIDTVEMRAQLTPPASFVKLVPSWLPAEDFIEMVRGREGVGAETARRWSGQLNSMEPREDVALFLHSTPDGDDRWFSRFIFLKRGEAESADD